MNIKVYAVADRLIPAIDPFGAPTKTRQYVGRDMSGKALSEGSDVLDCAYIRTAIAQGDLSLEPPTAPPSEV